MKKKSLSRQDRNFNRKKLEYDYDEIVAASEIEVDEIIQGDSRNSAEHDELWLKSVNKFKRDVFAVLEKFTFSWCFKGAHYETSFSWARFLVLRVEMKCPWAELV